MTENLLFKDVFEKNLEIEFTKNDMSSDTGLLLFRPILTKLNLAEKMSAILHDPRNPLYIQHAQTELIEQRLAMMICGYHDHNDNDYLRNDPAFKLFSKGSNSQVELASTPTMFRFDDRVTLDECKKLVELQVQLYIERNIKRFDKEFKKEGFISIDIHADPTDIQTYGGQQLALYNTHYSGTCFLPMVITDGKNGDLICAFLRPGTKHACWCLQSALTRIFKIIEAKYKNVRYNFKADSGFQKESFFSFLEKKEHMTFEIALATNKSLEKLIQDGYHKNFEITYEDNVLKIYQEFGYKAESWTRFRRVVVKIEINRHGQTIRYIMTNEQMTPLETFESYYQRCNVENRIKELKSFSGGDRLSAHDFSSNFFRFNLACFVLVTFQEFKKKLPSGTHETSYVSTIREKFIKIAGIIKISTRRILIELSTNHPSNKFCGPLFST